MQREKTILKTSYISIAMNLLLAFVKWLAGMAVGSVAMISDAANNLTDSASSVLTIVGTRLAMKKPDDEHPFGYGRLEYMTSLVIAALILTTGFETMLQSVRAILHPQPANYGIPALTVMVVAILAKALFGWYAKREGTRVKAPSLNALGLDAQSDAMISSVILLSAFIRLIFHVVIDGWASAFVSFFILKSGYEIIRDSLNQLLGERNDEKLTREMIDYIEQTPEILSANDLIIHNYGPSHNFGTVNVELNGKERIEEIYPILHKLQVQVYQKFHVYVIFGFYSVNPDNKLNQKMEKMLEKFIAGHPNVLSYHALFIDEKDKVIYCDLVVSHTANRDKLLSEVNAATQEVMPGYTPLFAFDTRFN